MGWLDKFEDKEKKTQNKYPGIPQYVMTGTPEYEKLYKEGRVGKYNLMTDTYYLPDLQGPEIVATNQSGARAVREGQANFLLGAAELSNQPLKRLTGAFTGKEQLPSEAIGYQNPEGFWQNAGNFALDATLDPTNLLGAGLVTGFVKGGVKASGKAALSAATLGLTDISKGVATRVSERGIGAINPFYYKVNPNLMYKSLNENQVKGITSRGVIYKNVANEDYGAYIPIFGEDGSINYMFKNMNKKTSVSGPQAFVHNGRSFTPIDINLVESRLKKKQPVYKLNPSHGPNDSRKFVRYNPMELQKGKAFMSSPDVQFVKGRIEKAFTPDIKKHKRIDANYIIEADPKMVPFLRAVKGKVDNTFEPITKVGQRGLPANVLDNEFLPLNDPGIRVMKKSPFWGYKPIKDGNFEIARDPLKVAAENINLFKDKSRKVVQNMDIYYDMQIVPDLFKAKNLRKLREKELDDASVARNHLNYFSGLIDQREQAINKLKYNPLMYDFERRLKDKFFQNHPNFNAWADPISTKVDNYSLGNEPNEIIEVGTNPLSKATNLGKVKVRNFRTNEVIETNINLPGEIRKYNLEGKQLKTRYERLEDVQLNEAYKNTLRTNIEEIENLIPGAKVYGSARGVVEGDLPHATHDYDILITQKDYEKNVKDKFKFKSDINEDTKSYQIKDWGDFDINIIYQDANGKATGKRAEEIFHQFYPDEYWKATKEQVKKGGNLKIPYTPQELIDSVNPTSKTIMDAYVSQKPKHINKIDSYIAYGNPDTVLEAQKRYLYNIIGTKGSLGHQFPEEAFQDVHENLRLLREIDFVGDDYAVARNPKRMQIAINDFYMNSSILSRGVDAKGELAEAALKNWEPQMGGGQAMGAGLNHVTLGDSGHGPVYGHKQIGLDLDISSPSNFIDSVKRQTSGSYPFSPEEAEKVKKILSKYGYNGYIPDNTGDLIHNLAYKNYAKDALKEVADATGRKIAVQGTYGNSMYASTLKDFDEQIDLLVYGYRKAIEPPKSHLQRSIYKGAPNQGFTSIKEFKKVQGMLQGGLARAEARYKELKTELTKLDDIINTRVERFKYNDSELKKLKAKKQAYEDEYFAAKKEADEISKRLTKVNRLKEKYEGFVKGSLGLGAGVGTLALGNKAVKKISEVNERREKQGLERKQEAIKRRETMIQTKKIKDYSPDMRGDDKKVTKGWMDKYQ